MKKGYILLFVFAVIIAVVLLSILLINKSLDVSKDTEPCLEYTETLQRNNCLTELAIEKKDKGICSSIESEKNKESCEYLYTLRTGEEVEVSGGYIQRKKKECEGDNIKSKYCLLGLAREENNPKICEEISDEKIKSECLIYTAGYSEEELKNVLLKNDPPLDVNTRIFGLNALTGFSCENVQFLLEMMQDDDALIRFKAIQRMKENKCYFVRLALNEEEVMNQVIDAYNAEPDKYVKAQIIRALGELGGDKTIPFVEETLRNSQTSNYLKISCLTALGNIGGEKSLDILNDYKDSSNELLRINARMSINKITGCKGDSCLPSGAEKYEDVSSCPPSNQDGGYCIRRVAENTNDLDLCYEAGSNKDICIDSIARLRKNATLCYEAGTFKEQCLEWCAYSHIPYTGAPRETNCNPPR